jgi:Ca2+/Na+ antiporter
VNVFAALDPEALKGLLRRLTVTAIAFGAGGVLVALAFGAPYTALGIAIGVAGGFANIRFVDRQIAGMDVESSASTKAVRRKIGSRTTLRLAVITVVAVGVVLLYAPLGIGIVVGLVLFQLAFIVNVIRAMTAQGGVE